MQNPNFMVVVLQFQTQPNTVSYRDRLGYARDLPVISLYHIGFPKIGGTQIESCETYGLGVLSCHGFPHIPIAYCSQGHSQHQWQLRFQGAVQRCTRWSARFDRWSLACRWETTDGDMFSPSSSPVWPLKNVNQIQTMKWWSCSKMFYMFFRAAVLWRSCWSGWLGHGFWWQGKGRLKEQQACCSRTSCRNWRSFWKLTWRARKSSSKGGRASFCAQIMSDSVWICLVYSIYLHWIPALLNSSKQKLERSYSPFLRLPLSSANPGVNKNTGIIQF